MGSISLKYFGQESFNSKDGLGTKLIWALSFWLNEIIRIIYSNKNLIKNSKGA